MNQLTPARLIKEKDLQANAEAFRECLRFILEGSVRSVLDVRYGLGGWAKEIRSRFPNAKIRGWEADSETAEQAWTDEDVRITIGEYPRGRSISFPDLVVADFNILTVLNRFLLDQLLTSVSPRYLIFTDVACVKLHLNYPYYGLDSPDLDKYWNRFQVQNYELQGWSRKHHPASTSVWKRKCPG